MVSRDERYPASSQSTSLIYRTLPVIELDYGEVCPPAPHFPVLYALLIRLRDHQRFLSSQSCQVPLGPENNKVFGALILQVPGAQGVNG